MVIKYILRKLMYLAVVKKLRQFAIDIENPAAAQLRRFKAIVGPNSETKFGQEHYFRHIDSIDDYRKCVPIQRYEEFIPYIQRMREGEKNVLVAANVSMFGVTSGSSAEPKFIPVTRSFVLEHHNSHLLWMYNMIEARGNEIVGGVFSMVSPAVQGVTTGGTPFGSSSGMQYRDQSIPIRMLHVLPYSVFLIADPVAKYHVSLAFALSSDLRVVNSVNPSTLVLLAKVLEERAEGLIDDIERGEFNNAPNLSCDEKTILEASFKAVPEKAAFLRGILKSEGKLTPEIVWPNLRSINTWQGGNAPFYLGKVKKLWGNVPQRCLGLRATEGMFSIPLEDYTSSGVLAVGGHFMEFVEDGVEVKAQTQTLLGHELEIGKKYRMIISTSAGLYRYDLGDIVEVTGMRGNTPEIAFLHKAGGVLSLTGEKVYEDQIVKAMAEVGNSSELEVVGFTVTFETDGDPSYILAVELKDECFSKEQGQELVELFDRELSVCNLEYNEKRISGRLGMPRLWLLAAGSYNEYRDYLVKNGRPDGQIKPPHIVCRKFVDGKALFNSDFFANVRIIEKL